MIACQLQNFSGFSTLAVPLQEKPQPFSTEKKTPTDVRHVHTCICECGLESEAISFGNHILLLYVESKSIHHAQQIFYKLRHPNQDSWNFLIQVYNESGHPQHAFFLFHEMQEEDVEPNIHTYVALLKASAKLKDLSRGQNLHHEIVEQTFERDVIVGSVLVDMYAKCSLLAEAQDVFDELPGRNVFSWTALMAGYADHGLGEKVLYLLEQMECEGVCPNQVTLMCSLKACSCIQLFERGLELHSRILKGGLERDTKIGNGLVVMFAKHGFLEEARHVFEQLSVRSVINWTALMMGYLECGLAEKVLECLEQMKSEGVSPDVLAFVCALKACVTISAIVKGKELHSEIIYEELDRDLLIGNCLVDMYSKFDLIEEAREVFEELQFSNRGIFDVQMNANANHSKLMEESGLSPDIASWTAVITSYAEQEDAGEALQLFACMLEQGILPTGITFVSILTACFSAAALKHGRAIHARICKVFGCDIASQVILATALIDMYSKCGSMRDAQQIFDAMPLRDRVAWNALISGFSCHGEIHSVMSLVEKMKMEVLVLDEAAILSVLVVCSHAGLTVTSQKHFKAMIAEHHISPTISHFNSVIDLLCRAGCLNEAFGVVNKMVVRLDLVTWSIILSACQTLPAMDLRRLAIQHMMKVDHGCDAVYVLTSNFLSSMW